VAAGLAEPFDGVVGCDLRDDEALLALVAPTFADAVAGNHRWCAGGRHDSAQKLGQAPSGSRLGADSALLVKEVRQIGDVHRAMRLGPRAMAAALCSGPDAR